MPVAEVSRRTLNAPSPDEAARRASHLPAGPSPWEQRNAATVRPGLDFSLIGLVFCSMMMFMGLAAMNSQANLLFAVFGLMIGVLLVSWATSRWVLRNIAVRRILPESAQVGRPVQIIYDVANRKRFWPTFSLTISELDVGGAGEAFDRQPHAYVLHAAAGMDARVAAELVPLRRGWVELTRYQLSTSFPFGFIKRAITRRVLDRMLVMPARGAVEPTAVLRFLSARSTGLNQRPREGGSDELYGARDYRAGDAPRMIHWRRSARSLALRSPDKPFGSLVVKQMTRVAPPRLVVMVDTYAPPAETGAEGSEVYRAALGMVEKNLAVASSLIAAATARGLSVGLLLWRDGPGGRKDSARDGRWLEVRPSRGKRHRRDLLTALAEAPRNDEANVEALLARGLPLAQGEITGLLITAGQQAPVINSPPAEDGAENENPMQLPGEATRRRGRFAGDVRRIGRGNLLVIRTATPDLDRWVHFDPRLNWAAMAMTEETA